MYDILIVGGGPAGLTAALYGARAGFSTAVLEQMFAGGQITNVDMIENYPGFPQGIKGIDLAMAMEEQARRFGAETIYDTAIRLSQEGEIRKVEGNGGAYEARTVVLALGATPKTLGLEREEELRGKGVSYCATCDGAFFRDKKVAVVGGGNTALTDAEYLARFCKEIYVVHRRNEFRASAVLVERVKKLSNVKFCTPYTPKEILGGEKVEGLRIERANDQAVEDLPVEGIFIAVGTKPQTAWLQGTIELRENGSIPFHKDFRTNIPGVFAAGDALDSEFRQIVVAAAQGAQAIRQAEEYLQNAGF